MRPPFGTQSPESFLTARMMGYTVVNWSASGEDWQGEPSSAVVERILSGVQPGGIGSLHDGWEPPFRQTKWQPAYELMQDRRPTLEALPLIIEYLQSRGYQFVTVGQMMRVGTLIKRSWFT